MSFRDKILFGLSLLVLIGCVTEAPNSEYVLAREALNSAREVDSARYAPGYYYKAEEAYRHAMSSYNDRSYKDAVGFFKATIGFAEKAENAARVQRHKAGDEGL